MINFRPQDTFGIDMAQKRKRGMQDDYTCSKCQYWTCRIDNYIRHLRDLCAFNKDFFAWDEGTLKEVSLLHAYHSIETREGLGNNLNLIFVFGL